MLSVNQKHSNAALYLLKTVIIYTVFAESEGGADLYITHSGSGEYVGIQRFGSKRVGPPNKAKGILKETDWFYVKKLEVFFLDAVPLNIHMS